MSVDEKDQTGPLCVAVIAQTSLFLCVSALNAEAGLWVGPLQVCGLPCTIQAELDPCPRAPAVLFKHCLRETCCFFFNVINALKWNNRRQTIQQWLATNLNVSININMFGFSLHLYYLENYYSRAAQLSVLTRNGRNKIDETVYILCTSFT